MKRKFLGTICCLTVFAGLSLNIVCFAATSAFAEHYNAAQNYLMQNQYSSAIAEFRKALKINYLDNSARIGIINAFLARATYYANQEKNYDKAADKRVKRVSYVLSWDTLSSYVVRRIPEKAPS